MAVPWLGHVERAEWTSSLLAAMLVAQSAQLQSRLSAKAVVREKRKLDPNSYKTEFKSVFAA